MSWVRPVCFSPAGARGAVVRGTCAAVLSRAHSSALRLAAETCRVRAWVEIVRSSLNSDGRRSRICPLTEKPVPSEGFRRAFRGCFSIFRNPVIPCFVRSLRVRSPPEWLANRGAVLPLLTPPLGVCKVGFHTADSAAPARYLVAKPPAD